MKKIFVFSIVVIASISAVCYTNQDSSKKLNQLAMANIEALSEDEDDGYDYVNVMYDFVMKEYPDGTVIQEVVYRGKDCLGKGSLPC